MYHSFKKLPTPLAKDRTSELGMYSAGDRGSTVQEE